MASEALKAFLRDPRNVIVAGIRKDGRPHVSPNWYFWDGEKFYISTTKNRAKYRIFQRDPRAELLFDQQDPQCYVEIPTTVEIREDIPANAHLFRAIREKHGRPVPPGEEFTAALAAEDRVLLAFTPAPESEWQLWMIS
jgi:PPOX class probable F420-dependent enzyme